MRANDPRHCQAELNLRQKAARAVNRDSVEEFCQLLRGRGWVTAAQIRKLRPVWNERFIRLLAQHSQGRVVSGPGMPGYCSAEEVNDRDLEHAGNSLLSQGRIMAKRGITFLRQLALRRKLQEITK